ncbi:MAG: CpsD/CapB family tyrosine-protein kinase [Pseudomonadota bacterium]
MEKIQQALERARHQRTERSTTAAATAAAVKETRGFALDASNEFDLDQRNANAHRLVAALPDDPRGDIFRRLRTQTLQRLQIVGGNSLAILSGRDGEGKTMVACNLALALARQATGPVFLVDFDFRRPSVQTVLGIEADLGVGDYLEGEAALADIVWRCREFPALHVLPQTRPLQHCSELMAAPAARELMRQLREDVPNSTVVVDSSPLLMTDEPLIVQRYVDGCLLVVQLGRTLSDDVTSTAQQIEEAKYLGHVLNQVPPGEVQSGLGYGYR